MGQPNLELFFNPIAFAIALFRFQLNAVWLVLGGAAIGFLSSLIIG